MTAGVAAFPCRAVDSRQVKLSPPVGHVVAITFPEAGKLRSRKVISRSKGRPTGKYPSWKMHRMLQWESTHELNAFRLLDANPAVLRFEEQPLTVKYVLDGVEHVHYPDVLVVSDGLKELWEIKVRADALNAETVRRTELMTSALPTFGYCYRMVIAEDLASEPRLSNSLELLRHGRREIPPIKREHLRRRLNDIVHLTWGAVLAGAFGDRSKAYACRLVLEGALWVDMDAPLSERSIVSVPRRGKAAHGASS